MSTPCLTLTLTRKGWKRSGPPPGRGAVFDTLDKKNLVDLQVHYCPHMGQHFGTGSPGTGCPKAATFFLITGNEPFFLAYTHNIASWTMSNSWIHHPATFFGFLRSLFGAGLGKFFTPGRQREGCCGGASATRNLDNNYWLINTGAKVTCRLQSKSARFIKTQKE